MARPIAALALTLALATASRAHFVFVVPEPGGGKALVVMSEGIDEDEQIDAKILANTKLLLRGADGKDIPLETVMGKHALVVNLPGAGMRIVHGATPLGVRQRGSAPGFLLRYLPKTIVGPLPADGGKVGAPFEILPIVNGAKLRFLLLVAGKPVEGLEVNVVAGPPSVVKKVKTGADGMTPEFEGAGRYGMWARSIVAKAGEADGKKYAEARDYATLVFDFEPNTAAKASTVGVNSSEAQWPPMREAVSSFGAAVLDGWVYTYGGHAGKTHQYSNATTLGKFRKLDLANPSNGWQDLPEGPRCQGTALVAHKGKLYRIGGMEPFNKPGEKGDLRSVASVAAFDPNVGKWEPMPDLPQPRSSHDACMVGDLLVVAGGWCMNGKDKESDWYETALVMDLSRNPPAWKSIPQPFRRRALNLGAMAGRVYVVGGLSEDAETEVRVDVLDPVSGAWSEGPALPASGMNGFSPAVATVGHRLIASPADGKIYQLTETGKAWEEVGSIKIKRLVHRAVPHGDGVLVLGGGAKAGNVAETEFAALACCSSKTASGKTVGSAGGQQYCPVMTRVPIGNDSKDVEWNGVAIKVCCATCLKRFQAEPVAYLLPDLLPQLIGKSLPARQTWNTFCPVMTDRVVSSRDPYLMVEGKKVHFWSEAAKKRYLAEPSKYPLDRIKPASLAGATAVKAN